MNTLFSFLSTLSNFKKLSIHVLQVNLYIRFLKLKRDMFYVLHVTISNLIIVSKINFYVPVTDFFVLSLANNFKLERPLAEKLEFKQLDGVFEMF